MNPTVPDSQTLLNQIVIEFMREQRRKRRSRWITRLIILLILAMGGYHAFKTLNDDTQLRDQDHAGLIDVIGEIADEGPVTADDFAKSLEQAYKSKGLKALVLRINSPGGSPVQADYMYNQIQFYRKTYTDIPVYAVCVDLCASAAYYVAASANKIYANPSSLVGSIGVLYNGFGAVDAMQKLGVSRRLYTAGKNKGFLDPFSPANPEQVQLMQNMLDDVHQTFIAKVKAGRGNRLKMNDSLFSGLVWTGSQAKALGLIDAFASPGELARQQLKLDHTIDYTVKKSVLDRFAKSMHASLNIPGLGAQTTLALR